MLGTRILDTYINEHKKLYKKRLNTLFSKVYDLIEKTEMGEENISLEITRYGYFITIKDYNSVLEKTVYNMFDSGAYKRLKEWYSIDEKEFVKKLDERIAYIDNHIKIVNKLKDKLQ
ncbi:hypothetical protein ACN9KI_03480 [Aliarcobacter butzleri]|uniref:hypothetical protein n=1 Tax=Aliarcobacter butzleri TaxID=28197 RepID=UPI003B215E8E